MKKYKAIFFDWDGTAVISRKAPADEAAGYMKKLLVQGIKLIIVSGTTYENIAKGAIQDYFSEEELKHLYLGLGRGAFNYKFENKNPVIFENKIPDEKGILDIHDICYEIHRELWLRYHYETDIVFSRPNYCKIDIMVDHYRGDSLFLQENEVESLREQLASHQIVGIGQLIQLAEEIGEAHGVLVKATCDAKYLEVGISDKSDNVRVLLKEIGIPAKECSFWGDEYVGLEKSVYGSDSFLYTEESKEGDFFDVSSVQGSRPKGVKQLGGGVSTFLHFLEEQA